MSTTVVVPVDLAAPEKASAMVAAAKRLGGDDVRIIMTNVVEDIPSYVAAELPSEIMETSRKNAHDEMVDLAQHSGVKADVVVRMGQPATAILAVAEENKADYIIVGSHRPGLQDYFLGSTAARIVRHAQCSVLVLR